LSTVAYAGPAEPPTDPDGATGRLARWLQDLRLEDVPDAVLRRAKDVILDGLGCALVGAQLPWSRRAVEIVTRFEGTGDKTLIGWGRTTSGPAAALLNGTFIQGFELDDFHPLAPLHSSAVVLPALFACADELGNVSGKQFLLAAIAGFEIGPRVGLALHGAQMLSRGWHSGSVFGTHAAAAATGVLLDLDAARFEDALGLAGTQSGGLMAAQYEAMSKRMHHGFASRAGLASAYLAAGGYTGIKRVFEREYGGFLSVFGEGHEPDIHQIAEGLGDRWETLAIAIKQYAVMGAVHSPLDALFDIGAQRRLVAAEIAHIDVAMSHAAYHHGWWVLERPVTPVGAQMNVAFALAVAVLDGAAMVAQFAPRRIDSDDVWELIPKITARHEPEFDAGGPQMRGAVRLAVTFTDGSTLEAYRQTPKLISEPLDCAGVEAKFRVLTTGLIAAERRDAIVATVAGLESLANVAVLIDQLGPPVGSPFEADLPRRPA
jgi:aconitate decarboxylase